MWRVFLGSRNSILWYSQIFHCQVRMLAWNYIQIKGNRPFVQMKNNRPACLAKFIREEKLMKLMHPILWSPWMNDARTIDLPITLRKETTIHIQHLTHKYIFYFKLSKKYKCLIWYAYLTWGKVLNSFINYMVLPHP